VRTMKILVGAIKIQVLEKSLVRGKYIAKVGEVTVEFNLCYLRNGEKFKLKRTIKTLELKMKDMQSTSRATSQDKTGWKGEELIFVKDVNDFCRDRLYPKEKFLRKNWQEYLPYDTRSLYLVCMKYLSIPDFADKRDIWYRAIVPSFRYKYQSMKCNMNNRVKSIYLSMKYLLEYAKMSCTY
jgi:hypothetical protein